MIRWGGCAFAALFILLAAGATTFVGPGNFFLRAGDTVLMGNDSVSLAVIGDRNGATVGVFGFSDGTTQVTDYVAQLQSVTQLGINLEMKYLVFTEGDRLQSYANVTVTRAYVPPVATATPTTTSTTTTTLLRIVSTTLPTPTPVPVSSPLANEPTQSWLDGLIKWMVNVLSHL